MKKTIKIITLLLASLMILTACNTTVNKKDDEKQTEAKTEEKETKTEELSEEEQWKKEPMYGKTIKYGYNGGLCTGGPGIAIALGMFKEAGIDVEVVSTQSKADAVGTGKADLTSDHIATLLVPSVNGVNMIFKAAAQTGCKSLYVLNNDDIKTTADLVGKKIGLPDGIGNSDHNIALRFLNHDKIKPEDVKFIPVEGSASILALQNGEISGVILSDQFAEKFVNDGTIKYIRSLTWDDDFKKEACCVYAFNKTFAEENPITAKKMVEVLFKVSDYIQNNIEEATKVLFDNNWASGDFDQAVRMMKSYNWQVTNEMTETTLHDVLTDYKTFGIINSEKSADELLSDIWHPENYTHKN